MILACLIGIAQPAGAQSLIGGLFGDESSLTPFEKWKRTIMRQLNERIPRLNLGAGRVVVDYRIDRAGHVRDIKLVSFSSNAQALVVAGMIASLKLPPPPPGAGPDDGWFRQSFYF
jgi:hypothetical protein